MPPSLVERDALEDGLEAASVANSIDDKGEDAELLDDRDWKRFFKDALASSEEFQQQKLRKSWSRSYRAFQSRHPDGTKYDTPRYRHRSKLFKPKTRQAVRKNMATAAAAMFSTSDVVSISATRPSDPVQKIGAKLMGAIFNYRFDRTNPLAGPNWFMTVLGAHMDAQLTGICVSKQYWEYETFEADEIVTVEAVDELTGEPLIDPVTGSPVLEDILETQTMVRRDRPMVENLPSEQAFLDFTGDWRDPVQEGGYFIAGYPVRDNDLETWIRRESDRPRMGGGAWREDLDISKIRAHGKTEQRNTKSVRLAREEGQDRYESRHGSQEDDTLWIYEVFYRYNGEDWTWWMLGETIMLSDPIPTRHAYPEQKGERPYVRGVASVETHKAYPSAPVESWQQLQQEMNEITNLTLDARKMSISPITKVVRGRNIDMRQVQNRGPDSTIAVDAADDVTFDKAPGPDGGSQQDMNNLAVDFDELAGVFSTGSVQTNRQLNETVGGMQMMQGSSNALTEFDLRVWNETWVEPVIRQVVNLIQYFEADKTVLEVCGETVGVLIGGQRPKASGGLSSPDKRDMEQEPDISIGEIMGQFERLSCSVRVDAGTGAMDTAQKFNKFMGGVKMSMELMPLLAADGITMDGPAIIEEGWGLMGYKDADRFYKRQDPGQKKPSEEEMKAKAEAEQAKREEMRKDAEFKRKEAMDKAEFDRKKEMDDATMAREREKHEWAQNDRALDKLTGIADRQSQHREGIEKKQSETQAKQATSVNDGTMQALAAALTGMQQQIEQMARVIAAQQQQGA